MKEQMCLDAEFAKLWNLGNDFDRIMNLTGTIYRQQPGRITLRFTLTGKAYFAKLHYGVGWREIFKNLLKLRKPVIGASNEWRALRLLPKIGIKTLNLVGFGWRGNNPATRQSFVITEELINTMSLEDYCARWCKYPPSLALKRALLKAVATLAARLHAAGVNHRDFYLCHFHLQDANALLTDASRAQSLSLYLIDLHRAQIRAKVPLRWRIKDLSGLYYSAMDLGLGQRDLLYFIKQYHGVGKQSLRAALTEQRRLWEAVERWACSLYKKEQRRALAKAWPKSSKC